MQDYCKYYKITKKDTVLDCGANTGFIYRALFKKCKHCFSIEPNVNTFNILIKNTKQYNNITYINKAVNDKRDILKLYHVENDLDGKCSFTEYKRKDHVVNGYGFVLGETIDQILNGEKVSFIKMDVQGAEIKALQGASETLKDCEHIAIECHNIGGVMTNNEVKHLLSDNGFKLIDNRYNRGLVFGTKKGIEIYE